MDRQIGKRKKKKKKKIVCNLFLPSETRDWIHLSDYIKFDYIYAGHFRLLYTQYYLLLCAAELFSAGSTIKSSHLKAKDFVQMDHTSDFIDFMDQISTCGTKDQLLYRCMQCRCPKMAEQIVPYLSALGFKILNIILEGPSKNAPVQDVANVMPDKTNRFL